jgi:hypothetical protein
MRKYKLTSGTVQAFIVCMESPMFLHHFGKPEYDSAKPIITESIRNQAAPIVADLNEGLISEADAIVALDKIWY